MGAATLTIRTIGGDSGSSAQFAAAQPGQATLVGTGSTNAAERRIAASAKPNTSRQMAVITFVGSSSYADGGETADWTTVGFTAVDLVLPLGLVTEGAQTTGALGTGNILLWGYDYANSKFIYYQDTVAAGPFVQVTATTDVSTFRYSALVIGT